MCVESYAWQVCSPVIHRRVIKFSSIKAVFMAVWLNQCESKGALLNVEWSGCDVSSSMQQFVQCPPVLIFSQCGSCARSRSNEQERQKGPGSLLWGSGGIACRLSTTQTLIIQSFLGTCTGELFTHSHMFTARIMNVSCSLMCFEQFIRFEKLCARYLFAKKYEGLYECASFGQLGTLVMIQYEILLHFFLCSGQ